MNLGHFTRPMTLLSAFSIASLLGGCNVFSRFDHPTSDPQLISAARAALDQGDLATAQDLYQKVSNDQIDIKNSEAAFLTMAEQGVTMAALIEFVGNLKDHGSGYALTKFAERIYKSGVGETQRLAIYSAYQNNTGISDPSLKSFVKFTAALALAGEILAEATSSDGILHKTDLAKNGQACALPGITSSCDDPTGTHLTSSSGSDITTTAPSGTYPNLDQLYYSINAAYNALNELGASGNFGSASSDFKSVLNQMGATQPSSSTAMVRVFRAQLVSGLNIGE